MAIYQSMQRVRFSSPDGYEKFKLLFGEVRNQLKTLAGVPAPDVVGPSPGSQLVQRDQPVDQPGGPQRLAHEHLPQASQGVGGSKRRHHGRHHHQFRAEEHSPDPRLPVLRQSTDKAYDLHLEQQVLAEPCPKCGFQFPDDAGNIRLARRCSRTFYRVLLRTAMA